VRAFYLCAGPWDCPIHFSVDPGADANSRSGRRGSARCAGGARERPRRATFTGGSCRGVGKLFRGARRGRRKAPQHISGDGFLRIIQLRTQGNKKQKPARGRHRAERDRAWGGWAEYLIEGQANTHLAGIGGRGGDGHSRRASSNFVEGKTPARNRGDIIGGSGAGGKLCLYLVKRRFPGGDV